MVDYNQTYLLILYIPIHKYERPTRMLVYTDRVIVHSGGRLSAFERKPARRT